MTRKVQSIYNFLSEFPKEMVDDVIENLSEEEHKLLVARYGEDLNNPHPSNSLNKEDSAKLYGSLIPKIKRRLKAQNNKKNNVRSKRKVQSIYTYLSEFPKEMIDEVIENLSEEEHKLLVARYGEDLNNPHPSDNFNRDDSSSFYGALLPRIKRHLKALNNKKNNVQPKRKLQSIYNYLDEFPKEMIDEVIENLSEEEHKLLVARYGEDLNNPHSSNSLNKKELISFYGSLIPKIRRRLNNLKNQEDKKSQKENYQKNKTNIIKEQVQTAPAPIEQLPLKKNNPKEENSLNNLTTKEGLKEVLELLTKPSFTVLLEVLTPKEAIVFCLRLGASVKAFKAEDIAEFLETDVQDVYDTTNRALDAFQENVVMLLEKEEQKIQELKLSLEKQEKHKK